MQNSRAAAYPRRAVENSTIGPETARSAEHAAPEMSPPRRIRIRLDSHSAILPVISESRRKNRIQLSVSVPPAEFQRERSIV